MLGFDGPLAVDRLSNRVHDPTDEGLADWHLGNAARALDRIAFLDADVIAHQYRADVVFLEIQCNAVEPARELEHFSGHGAIESVDLGNAVTDLDDGAGFLDVDLLV